MTVARSRPWLLLTVLVLGSAGCHRGTELPHHTEWVIESQLQFFAGDLSTARAPLPPSLYRLQFPYISGDLYGNPTTGDFVQPVITGASLRFDLNRTHAGLLASLEPTEFGLGYLRIHPANARLARLAPLALEADGIEPVGQVEWVDADSRQPLLLVFFDRPAAITGETRVGGRPLRYAIQADSAGYYWIERQNQTDADIYRTVPRPARLMLAVTIPPERTTQTHR